jgi:hypothetical protein
MTVFEQFAKLRGEFALVALTASVVQARLRAEMDGFAAD